MPAAVPFFRVELGDEEIEAVAATLRSGWLTSGPEVREFEAEFSHAVGATHAVAVNSGTAALHLAVEALGLGRGATRDDRAGGPARGQAVLVPTLTFAATAEVVLHQGATPILVDCDPVTGNLCLRDARRKLMAAGEGQLPVAIARDLQVVGIIPVHVGGLLMDPAATRAFAAEHRLWLVEDAAHAFPAAARSHPGDGWRRCGEATADVTCFSFYANKTITTGEGGMAVTESAEIAARMRSMSLHGISADAWRRYAGGAWDYQILAPGFKYNLTDVAATLGRAQLRRAATMRAARASLAAGYRTALAAIDELELPPAPPDRLHAWHLFPIRLCLERLTIDRDAFVAELRQRGVGFSVHWRPLHLHPYYQATFGWRPEDLPVASALWPRLVSLPLYPSMRADEHQRVIQVVTELCREHRR